MGILDGRVVLITDTGTYAGYYLALAINEAGARVIVNDETGGGTVRAAADALAKTIKRRGGKPALPAYGNFSSMRKCIEMVRAGPDKWDWLSGIVHIGPGADDLRLLIRAAQPEMSKWGGMIVTVDADAATAAVVTEQASVLAEHRITINAVRAGEADHTSMVCYLLAPISSSVTGQVINAEPDHSSKEIAANIVALLAAQAAPAAPAKKPAAKPASKPAAKPASKPAAKPASKPAAKPAAPAAKLTPARKSTRKSERKNTRKTKS